MMKRLFLFAITTSVLFSGCAAPHETIRTGAIARPAGVYHKVQPKETLWRIAKAYDVGVDEIVRANNIPDAARIQQDQLIFIPKAGSPKIVSLSEPSLSDDEFRWPLKGRIISYFGDTKSALGFNNGIHIKSDLGQSVFPARSGEVIFADDLSGYGPTLIIDHFDGCQTVYAYNSKLLVGVGERVTPQAAVSLTGGDGALAFLHFEVRKDSRARNPLHFLP